MISGSGELKCKGTRGAACFQALVQKKKKKNLQGINKHSEHVGGRIDSPPRHIHLCFLFPLMEKALMQTEGATCSLWPGHRDRERSALHHLQFIWTVTDASQISSTFAHGRNGLIVFCTLAKHGSGIIESRDVTYLQ